MSEACENTLSVKTGGRKKIGIVRGPGLSKWEMQTYEPLISSFDLVGIGSTKPVNDIDGISFPIKQLESPAQWFSMVPGMIPIMYQLFGDTQWLRGFNEAVQGFDLLHGVELRNGYSLQAVRAKKLGLVKAVTLTVYENIPFVGDHYPRRRAIKEEVVAGTDLFFAANEMARQALMVEDVADEKILIVPQSVDTSRFTPRNKISVNGVGGQASSCKLRKKYGINGEDFVVLSVGRMVWEKGWEDLLACAKRISNDKFLISNKRMVKFLFIGEGPELPKYRAMVRRLGIEDNVYFPGGVSYSEMPDVFRSADLFVSASVSTRVWNEQFSRSLLEAMATGMPIVGTLSGGTKDVVGEGGVFVQPQYFSELAHAIVDLYLKPNLRKKLGQRNRNKTKKVYETTTVSGDIASLWKQLLNSR